MNITILTNLTNQTNQINQTLYTTINTTKHLGGGASLVGYLLSIIG